MSAIVGFVAYAQAEVVPSQGILVNTIVVSGSAVAGACLLARGQVPQVAFIAGVLGTLVGTDLLHLPRLFGNGSPALSLGGGGVLDAIFVTGVLATASCPRTALAKERA